MAEFEISPVSPKETFSPSQELKMGLLSRGIIPTQRAIAAIQGQEGKPLTTDDYGTTQGIIVATKDDIAINAAFPANNPFAKDSPYTLDYRDEKLYVDSPHGSTEVTHIAPPAYMNQKLPQELQQGDKVVTYGDFIATHTDRARISPIKGCAMNCHFCNVPSEAKYHKVNKEALVAGVTKALVDPLRPAQHLLISGGTPGPRDYDYLNDVYETVAKEFPGLDIDVMMAPASARDGRELLDPKKLKEIGINALSINLELFNPEFAQAYMKDKHRIGQDKYLDFLERAVKEFGVGRVRSMLIVGIEPLEDTIKGIEALAERGVCPELSTFLPDPATPLKDLRPPTVTEMKRIYTKMHEILEKYRSQYPGLNDGLQCIDCMHNVLMFPGKDSYRPKYDPVEKKTTYEFPLKAA